MRGSLGAFLLKLFTQSQPFRILLLLRFRSEVVHAQALPGEHEMDCTNGTGVSSCPLFEKAEEGEEVWSYLPPSPPSPPPLVSSLLSLQKALPDSPSPRNRYQNTLQALTSFTGYIASETYAMPINFRYTSGGISSTLSAEEEDVRREIRALKGLMLNRCAVHLMLTLFVGD